MSGEAEIELEVDANVEIEIEVQPEVELEVEVDIEAPKVEIEVEVEIEVPQVEIEIDCPDLNVESNLEGKLNAEVEVGGSTHIVYEHTEGGNSHHMPDSLCRWMFIMIIFGILAVGFFAYFCLSAYRLSVGKHFNWAIIVFGMIMPLISIGLFVMTILCYIKAKKDAKDFQFNQHTTFPGQFDLGYVPAPAPVYKADPHFQVQPGQWKAQFSNNAPSQYPQADVNYEAGGGVDVEGGIELAVNLEAPVVEVEIDAGVEVEIDVDVAPEVEIEVELDAGVEAEVELEAGVEIDAGVEVEVEVEIEA